MRETYIFLGAVLLRLAYSINSWVAGDTPDYLALAESIRNGQFNLNGVPTTFRPPLYPLMVSLFGDATIIVQCILGGLTCVLIYRISRSIWPAVFYSVLPMSLHYTAVIMTETLFVFLVVLGVYCWTRKWIYSAGIIFGLAALCRPVALLMLGLALVISFLIKHYRRRTAIMLGIAVLVCLPWMIRNSIVDGKITLTQSSAFGTNLLYGTFTHEEFGPTIWDEALKRKWNEGDGIARIKNDPMMWLRARTEQYPRLFIDTVDYLTSNYWLRLVFVLAQMVLFGLAIVGLFTRPKMPLWIMPLFLVLFHLPLWVETRYFLPAMPFVCILAWEGIKAQKRRSTSFSAKAPDQIPH